MLQAIRRILGWVWTTVIIGVPKVSVVDPSQAPTDPAAPAEVAPAEAPAAAPRGIAAIVADVEGAVQKLKDFASQRSLLDAAEAEARSILASLKSEWEAEKAKLEAFF